MNAWRAALVVLIVTAVLPVGVPGSAGGAFDTKTAGFALVFHGERSAYLDASVVVMPDEAVIFDAVGPAGKYTLETDHGIAVQRSARQFRWTAPGRSGTYKLTFEGPGRNDARDDIVVHAFVMVPATKVKAGFLNGYRIGEYPSTPLKGNPIYRPPPGFIEVTRENQDIKVSPHFTLKQFLCKQDTAREFPQYLVLNERLPLKLEAVLERVNELGIKADTLNVMSAYRTPYYNHAIGDVKYSMHQWGSAADVYVDPQKKNRMEDLNRDGKVDIRDAKRLYDEIEQMLSTKERRGLQGGMGYYPASSAHPPFVHVDVRGTAARWKG